jgi:nucleoside-diphosphate-sugar epimerase
MKNKYVLITGSDGLVGSDAVIHFSNLGYKILGIDNNSRMKFFGQEASILWKRNYLKKTYLNIFISIKILQIKSRWKKYLVNTQPILKL